MFLLRLAQGTLVFIGIILISGIIFIILGQMQFSLVLLLRTLFVVLLTSGWSFATIKKEKARLANLETTKVK